MSNCKHCGKPERQHALNGLCDSEDNCFDDGTEEKEKFEERLEHAAIAAMQGLLANPAFVQFAGAVISKEAIEQAEALIKALDERKRK